MLLKIFLGLLFFAILFILGVLHYRSAYTFYRNHPKHPISSYFYAPNNNHYVPNYVVNYNQPFGNIPLRHTRNMSYDLRGDVPISRIPMVFNDSEL